MPDIDSSTHEALARIAVAHGDALREVLGLWGPHAGLSVLDEKTVALARLATLIALDAPPAAFGRQVAEAGRAGATPGEMLALMQAIAPQVGSLKTIAAAPEIMLALGLSLPDASDQADGMP
jgi:alkylhydroperoxidase/carboxymuconolactone decarboxylase family protein YurZ